jgi:hypothetical protein
VPITGVVGLLKLCSRVDDDRWRRLDVVAALRPLEPVRRHPGFNDPVSLGVAGADWCVPKFSQRADRVVVRVFKQAQRAGEPVTMPLVKRVIAELGEPVSAQQVYQMAAIWERSASVTRRRARL